MRFNDNRWERVIHLLVKQGYIVSGDIPSDEADKILEEMCRLGWLTQEGNRYEPGELARLHLDL